MINEYKFGAWLPDQTDFRNPGLEDAENVIPSPNGYIPAREFVAGSTSISGTIIGASSVFLKDGSVLVLVATTTDLHVIRGSSVTASSLSLSLATTETVVFTQFNTEVYATTKSGTTWVLTDIESDNTFSGASGSPPSANAMGRVADFLVMGDLTDIDASDSPYRIRWSRFNNPQGAWDTDLGAQSGAQELDAKYGPVTAITGGSFGLIFQTSGVTRISFTGSASVFDLDTFEENRGCVAPSSAVQVGERTFYLAHDGFFRTDGTTPEPISTARIWDWFIKECNQTFLPFVAGAVDYQRRCVVWAFPGGNTRALTRQIWFNWETEQWGSVSQPLDWLVEGAKSGLSLEDVAAIYPNLDTMPLTLDSPEFQPSGRNLLVLQGGDLGNVLGSTLKATFRGGDIHPRPGERSFVSEVTPLIEAENINVRLLCRDKMTGPAMESPTSAVGPIGFAPFNHDARYYGVIIEVPAGEEWSNPYGYQVNAGRSGST